MSLTLSEAAVLARKVAKQQKPYDAKVDMTLN